MTVVAKAKARALKKPKKRQQPTLLVKRFPQDLYGRCVTFVYGSVADATAYFKREHEKANDASGHVPLRASCSGHWKVIEQDGLEADYIFVKRDNGMMLELAVLAHETLHHVSHALRTNGIEHVEATDEAYTYYQQFMITQCLQAIRGGRHGRS